MNELAIQLTSEQQKQIKDATDKGHDRTESELCRTRSQTGSAAV
jgi:hypothetical protein